MHPGGIEHPEGYKLIFEIPVDDGSIKCQLENLLSNHQIDTRSVGVTVCLDRYGKTNGILHGRLIHDFQGVAYVFRRDFVEDDLSHFIIAFGHI